MAPMFQRLGMGVPSVPVVGRSLPDSWGDCGVAGKRSVLSGGNSEITWRAHMRVSENTWKAHIYASRVSSVVRHGRRRWGGMRGHPMARALFAPVALARTPGLPGPGSFFALGRGATGVFSASLLFGSGDGSCSHSIWGRAPGFGSPNIVATDPGFGGESVWFLRPLGSGGRAPSTTKPTSGVRPGCAFVLISCASAHL